MLGNRIKKARGKLSQEAVAKAVGVSRAAVSQWENGSTKDLKLTNFFELARLLKKNPEWLATGHGQEEPVQAYLRTAESNGEYRNLSDEAIKAAREWMKLPPLLQERFLEMMILFNASDRKLTITKMSQDKSINTTTKDLMRAIDGLRSNIVTTKKTTVK